MSGYTLAFRAMGLGPHLAVIGTHARLQRPDTRSPNVWGVLGKLTTWMLEGLSK